jgi:tRNA threonylcarbamoyladenosine biosynthesis protein TsaE
MTRFLPDEAATLEFGTALWRALEGGGLIFLSGELGAGKTTLARGLLRAAGVTGTVKSPTYTLVEEYRLPARMLYHFDLYRLSGAEELEWMGIRDYLESDALCLVEWPERGAGVLPEADLHLHLETSGEGRRIGISAATARGQVMLARLVGIMSP